MKWQSVVICGVLVAGACGPTPRLPARTVDPIADDKTNEAGLVRLGG